MTHFSDDELEQYCLGRLSDPVLARVEEHLLWCHKCIDRATASDRYIDALKAGIRRGGFDIELLAQEHRPKKDPLWI
jgi:anti-sigma factor RsiW